MTIVKQYRSRTSARRYRTVLDTDTRRVRCNCPGWHFRARGLRKPCWHSQDIRKSASL